MYDYRGAGVTKSKSYKTQEKGTDSKKSKVNETGNMSDERGTSEATD